MTILLAILFFGMGWVCSALYTYFDKQAAEKAVDEVKSDVAAAESAVKTEVASLQPKSPTQAN